MNNVEEDDEYSDMDNYEQIVANDSVREEPSMLESAGDDRILMKLQKKSNRDERSQGESEFSEKSK